MLRQHKISGGAAGLAEEVEHGLRRQRGGKGRVNTGAAGGAAKTGGGKGRATTGAAIRAGTGGGKGRATTGAEESAIVNNLPLVDFQQTYCAFTWIGVPHQGLHSINLKQ